MALGGGAAVREGRRGAGPPWLAPRSGRPSASYLRNRQYYILEDWILVRAASLLLLECLAHAPDDTLFRMDDRALASGRVDHRKGPANCR